MNILFMCVANSARSQIAEGLARQMFPQARIESAGSRPGKLNPFAVAALREIGVDITSHYSKSVDDLDKEFIASLNYVITLCAEEVCPVLPSMAKKLHWPLVDPATKENLPEPVVLDRFRATRDLIRVRLEGFKQTTEV